MISVSGDYIRMMAAYNQWANTRLYSACEGLSSSAWHQDRQNFFASMHDSLNHIWVGDNLWMARFRKQPKPDLKLDSVPFDDFDSLWQARQAFDQEIMAFAETLSDDDLGGILEYSDSAGNLHQQPFAGLLAHFFNHQSHHRGQVHTMLHQETGAAPALDLVYYLIWQGRLSG